MPDVLRDALRTRRWGLPDAGGWRDQDAGLVDAMEIAIDVYDAILADKRYGSDQYKFAAEHPREFGIMQHLRKANG